MQIVWSSVILTAIFLVIPILLLIGFIQLIKSSKNSQKTLLRIEGKLDELLVQSETDKE